MVRPAGTPTPPESEKEGPEGGGIHQEGDVNNHARYNSGVITGHVSGYAVITGTVNLTVQAANELTTSLEGFMARVAMASVKLDFVAQGVESTSASLTKINLLIKIQAKNENIPITTDRNLYDLTENERYRIIEGNDIEREEDSEILKEDCYKDLMKCSRKTREKFEEINEKIRMAYSNKIRPDTPSDAEQIELTDEEKEHLSLKEKNIEDMEHWIEAYKSEIHLKFYTFQQVLRHHRDERVDSTLLNGYRYLKAISDFLLKRGPPVQGLGVPGGNTIQQGMPYQPVYPPRPLPDWRPLEFPDLSRLTALYMGWILTKGHSPGSEIGSSKPSWKFPVQIRMEYSTEELFFKVLAQIAKRRKHNRTLEDDCKELLRSETQRKLVEDLKRDQNAWLQKRHPQLVWKLAGLECSYRKRRNSAEKPRRIKVILKTEWDPGPHPRGPTVRDGPWVQLGSGTGDGQPGGVGIFGYGGVAGSAAGEGVEIHQVVGDDQGHGAGGLTVGGSSMGERPYAEARENRHSHTRGTRARAGRARRIVVRHPQFVFVKEGGKSKAKRTREEVNGRRKYLRDDRRGSQIYIELREPGSYRTSGSATSSSSSLASSPHPILQPPPVQRPAVAIDSGMSNIPRPPGPGIQIAQGGREEMTPAQAREIVEDMISPWENLTNKRKKQEYVRTRARRARGHVSSVGITRSLMEEVELRDQVEGEIRRRQRFEREESERMRENPRRQEELWSKEKNKGKKKMKMESTITRERREDVGNDFGNVTMSSGLRPEASWEDYHEVSIRERRETPMRPTPHLSREDQGNGESSRTRQRWR